MLLHRAIALAAVAAVVTLAAWFTAETFGDPLLAAFAGALAMLPTLVAFSPFFERDDQSAVRIRKTSRLRSPSRT